MRAKQLSIRNILLLTVGLLTLLIVLLVLGEILTKWQDLARIESLKKATFVSDQLFDATEKISEERGITYSMLYAPDKATIDSLSTQLHESRRQADAALQASFQALKDYDFSEIGDQLQKLERQFSELQELRSRIDKAAAQPLKMRDSALPQHWFDQATVTILQVQDLWMGFMKHFADIEPVVTLHLRFKHFLGVIVEYSGRERSLIGRLLVENADPTPQEQAQLLQWEGAVDLGWKISATVADQGGLTPAITPYFNDAKSHYFTIYGMMRDIFYTPRVRHHGASYPIAVDFWLELATEATDSLYILKTQALKQGREYMDASETKARHEIVRDLLLLLVAVVLCFFSFRTISYRVIFPIRSMIDALVNATEGKTVSLAPLFKNRQDEIGQLAHVLDVFQKNAEEVRNAQASNALLAAIVQSSEDAILSKTPDDIITSWNLGAQHLLGYTPAEAIGQPVDLILPPDRKGDEKHITELLLKEGKPLEHFETQRKHKDGRNIDVSLTVSSIRDTSGKIIGASKIIRDVTARKAAERELIESRERYRAIVEASAQVIWVWKEGAIEKMSPLWEWWEKTTGQPAGDIATFGWLEVVHPDDRDRVKNIWTSAMATRSTFEMDYRLRARDGHFAYVEVKGVALLEPDGSVREFVGSLNDVTARKEAEAGLLNYTSALELSNKELDDFAYIASHDLKEPLRGLHNHARFLLEDNQDKLDAESVSRLNRLTYLSQRMERLVNDLLYFSRLGRQELAIQPADINEVIHDIESTLDVFMAERNARITIPKTLPTVTCDKLRVTEAFRNLITNAIKYNDSPERIVEIGFSDTQVSPAGKTLKNVFYVKDNGRGIASEFYDEVFRIFKRLQSASDSPEEGTGVGLTFVKKIIERHSGKIWLQSQPGKGTTFFFTLKGE